MFTSNELMLVLIGIEELDFSELKKNTQYKEGYSESSN